MNIPSNLKYTKDHEWVKVEGDIATVGITDYAQDQLGDIVFFSLTSRLRARILPKKKYSEPSRL